MKVNPTLDPTGEKNLYRLGDKQISVLTVFRFCKRISCCGELSERRFGYYTIVKLYFQTERNSLYKLHKFTQLTKNMRNDIRSGKLVVL